MIWTDVTRLNVTYPDMTWAACCDPSDVAELDLQQSEAASDKCPGPFTGTMVHTDIFNIGKAKPDRPFIQIIVSRYNDVDEASGCMVNAKVSEEHLYSTFFFLAYSNDLMLLYTEARTMDTSEQLPPPIKNLVLLSTTRFTLDDSKEMEIKQKLGDQLKDLCTKDFVDHMGSYLRLLKSCD